MVSGFKPIVPPFARRIYFDVITYTNFFIDSTSSQISFSSLDNNGTDQSVFLTSLVTHNMIRIKKQSDPSQYVIYKVLTNTAVSGGFSFNVQLISFNNTSGFTSTEGGSYPGDICLVEKLLAVNASFTDSYIQLNTNISPWNSSTILITLPTINPVGTVVSIHDVGGNPAYFYTSSFNILVASPAGSFTDGTTLKSITIPYGSLTLTSVTSNLWATVFTQSYTSTIVQSLSSLYVLSTLTALQHTNVSSNLLIKGTLSTLGNIEVAGAFTTFNDTFITGITLSNTLSNLGSIPNPYISTATFLQGLSNLGNNTSNSFINSNALSNYFSNIGSVYSYISTPSLVSSIQALSKTQGFISSISHLQNTFTNISSFLYNSNGVLATTPDISLSSGVYVSSVRTVSEFSNSLGDLTVDSNGSIYLANSGCNYINRCTNSAGVWSSSIWAGTGVAGSNNGTISAATFNSPKGLAFDTSGNLYVADTSNCIIRKIDVSGNVTNFAGDYLPGLARGTAPSITYTGVDYPKCLSYRKNTNSLYFGYRYGWGVISCSTSNITTIFNTSGGIIPGAVLNVNANYVIQNAEGIAVTDSGLLYITDNVMNSIHVIDADSNVSYGSTNLTLTPNISSFPNTVSSIVSITPLSGNLDGLTYLARVSSITKVAVDSYGIAYFTDRTSRSIKRLNNTAYGWTVTTVVGPNTSGNTSAGSVDGNTLVASLTLPYGIATNSNNVIYVCDPGASNIRSLTPNMGNTSLALTTQLVSTSSINVSGYSIASYYGLKGTMTTTSDIRLKHNITNLVNSLQNIYELRGIEYTRDGDTARRIGCIAQEVEAIYPEVVVTDKTSGLKAIYYELLTAPLVESIKELSARIEEIKKEVKAHTNSGQGV